MKQEKQKKRMSEETKVSLCRWWFVGMVYFLIGFGTSLGNSIDPLDLILVLGIGIGMGTVFIFHPIVYYMFNIKRRGKIANKKYQSRSVMEGVSLSLVEVVRCFAVVVLVFFVYQGINIALIALLGLAEDVVVVAGEPILFAVFFVLIYNASNAIYDAILDKLEKRNAQKEQKQ